MKFTNTFLDKLAGSHDKILVFDCEFWHIFESKGFLQFDKSRDEFYIPREFGGFLLTKNTDGSWSYKDDFFVTLAPPKGRNVSFVSPAFANVTKKTVDALNEYQSFFQTSSYSPDELRDLLKESTNVYLEDSIVKKAHKPNSWYKSFLTLLSESLVILKGKNDLDAIQNACKLYGLEYKKPKAVFDVAHWNRKSKKECGTAKLEGTFECIRDEVDPEIKKLYKMLPLGEAHNPLSDAAMTFIVALYIIQTR